MVGVSNLLNRVLVGVIFTLLVALSAGMGVASRQSAGAKAFTEDGDAAPSQSFGSAESGSESFGSAAGGSSSMGGAPTKKQGGSKSSSHKSGTKKKATKSTKKSSSKKGTSKKPASKKCGHKKPQTKPTTPVVAEPQEHPDTTPAPEQPTTRPQNEPNADKGEVLAPAKELPTTGPGQTLGLFTGVSLAGFAGHRLYLRRKS